MAALPVRPGINLSMMFLRFFPKGLERNRVKAPPVCISPDNVDVVSEEDEGVVEEDSDADVVDGDGDSGNSLGKTSSVVLEGCSYSDVIDDQLLSLSREEGIISHKDTS